MIQYHTDHGNRFVIRVAYRVHPQEVFNELHKGYEAQKGTQKAMKGSLTEE
jgi:hypothetical protein